jgi:hypothetical protein
MEPATPETSSAPTGIFIEPIKTEAPRGIPCESLARI